MDLPSHCRETSSWTGRWFSPRATELGRCRERPCSQKDTSTVSVLAGSESDDQFWTVMLTPELKPLPAELEASATRAYEPLGTVSVFQLHNHP
jgi:hypothetical protein